MRNTASNIYDDPAYHGAPDLTHHLGLREPKKHLPDLFCSPVPD